MMPLLFAIPASAQATVWLRNHGEVTLWSRSDPDAEAFRVIPRFVGLFRVETPLTSLNGRVWVYYPGDTAGGAAGYAWVDLADLGPADPPEHEGPLEWPEPPLVAEQPRPLPTGGGRVIRRIPTEAPLVALTLDDAIDYDVLDLLAERNVKATLFLTGAWAEARPDTVLRAAQEGHELANHTWSHPQLRPFGAAGTRHQIQSASLSLEQVVGAPTIPAFRPPFGEWDQAVLAGVAAEGYDLYLWDIDSPGYRPGVGAAAVVQHIVSRAQPGSIVLMHPLATADRQAIGAVIDELRGAGLEPARLSDLLYAAAW